ncbi:MAG: small, acid-soluble spore protein, alpha/beta type [Bacteroides sp.]
MPGKKKDLIKFEIKGHIIECEPQDTVKYEIADELGLLDKVADYGWKQLSAKEAGKIGGVLGARRRKEGNVRR